MNMRHLIIAGTLENYIRWTKSEACIKETADIPEGRLFAFLNGPDGKGYLVISE